MKQRLISAMLSTARGPSPNSNMTSLPSETTLVSETNPTFRPPFSFPSYMRAPPPQPSTRFANPSSSPPQPRLHLPFPTTSSMNSISAPLPVTPFTSAEEQNKRAAAAVAAKLTASSSSAQMLSSVLSSLAAEEAASKNGGLGLGVFTSSPRMYPVDKRPRLDVHNAFFGHLQPHQMASQSQVLAASMPQVSQTDQQPPPPLPPPPNQQYAHSHGAMPYSFAGSSSQPPLPPVPPPPQQPQQFSSMMGYFPPPGFGFYRAPAPVPAPEGSST